MIRRTLDAAFLNTVANHPEVRPQIGGAGEIDLQPLVNDVDSFALEADGGGFLFRNQGHGRFELHTLFLPDKRGLNVIRAAAAAARYMFTATPCTEIVTKLDAANKAADSMVRRCGFRPLFTTGAMHYFWLTLDDWRAQDLTLAKAGANFHDLLEAAKRAKGSDLPIHPDDEVHDRAVGLAVLMAKAGQPAKAVWVYNQWAELTGYAAVSLVTESPPVIDIGDAVLGLSGGELEVLLCR